VLQPELLLPSILPFVSTSAAAVETDIRGAAAAAAVQHNPMYSAAAAAASNSSSTNNSSRDSATVEAAAALAAAAAAAAGVSTAGRKRTLQQRLQEEALPELHAGVQQPSAPKKRATTAATTAATAAAAAAAATAGAGKGKAASSASTAAVSTAAASTADAAAAATAIAATATASDVNKGVSIWAGTHCYSAEPLFCVAEAAADEVSAQRFLTAFVPVEYLLCVCVCVLCFYAVLLDMYSCFEHTVCTFYLVVVYNGASVCIANAIESLLLCVTCYAMNCLFCCYPPTHTVCDFVFPMYLCEYMYTAMQESWLTHVKSLSTTPSAALQRMLEMCSNGSVTVGSETAAGVTVSIDEELNMLLRTATTMVTANNACCMLLLLLLLHTAACTLHALQEQHTPLCIECDCAG
jgi:hypothetical protein